MGSTKQRQPLMDILATVFGIGAWISVNGMWVELPLLVQALPEGWNLPSYMSIVIQIANIGPIIYSVSQGCFPSVIKEIPSIYIVMVIGVVASLLMALFWNFTSVIGGSEHSTALLILLFCLSLVDCTSSVLFMPFMAHFREIYLTSYLVGEGLSGFLPSIVALAQGVGGNPGCRNATDPNNSLWVLEPFYPEPRFSVQDFFFVLFSLMICSASAFLLLNVLSCAKKERITPSLQLEDQQEELSLGSDIPALSSPVDAGYATIDSSKEQIPSGESTRFSDHDEHRLVTKSILFYLLFIQAVLCLLSNGIMPSIQSYSCLPYGNTAFHLAVTLSTMSNPLACLVAFFLPIANPLALTALTIIGCGISSYIFILAAMSPLPPLVGKTSGEALMVVAWILFIGLLSYVKASIAAVLRNQRNKGAIYLFWFGVSTQIGSAIGSIIAFLLVNVYVIFEAYYPCV